MKPNEAKSMPDRRAEAQRNRDAMPQTAAIVDAWRRVFGQGVRLRYACENGREVGLRGSRGVPWSGPWIVPEVGRAGR